MLFLDIPQVCISSRQGLEDLLQHTHTFNILTLKLRRDRLMSIVWFDCPFDLETQRDILLIKKHLFSILPDPHNQS